jgi:DNA replication protein DnaC
MERQMGIIKDSIMALPEVNVNPTNKKNFHCDKHGEFEGFVMMVAGREIPSVCPECLEEERVAELDEFKKGQKQRERVDIFNQSCVPKRFQECGFGQYEPTCKDAEVVVKRLKNYVINFEKAKEKGASFLFLGNTGTGKTTLAAAVLNNVMNKGFTGVYVSTLNYLSKVKRSWVAGATVSEDELIESFVKFDLLVLDELGKGSCSPKEKGIIFRLLDRRYEEQKPTIGISICNEKVLNERIDPDASRRLKANGGVLNFNWATYTNSNSF